MIFNIWIWFQFWFSFPDMQSSNQMRSPAQKKELDQQDGDDEYALDDAAWGDITSFKQLVMVLDHRFRKLEKKIDRLDRKVTQQLAARVLERK
jgi:hypothetical protein